MPKRTSEASEAKSSEPKERRLTKRQQALANALADPEVKTTKQALEQAQYSQSVIRSDGYRTSEELRRNGSVTTAKLARLDKAKGLRALGEKLLLEGSRESERMDPAQKVGIGAGLIKLALEMKHKYGLDLDPEPGEQLDSFRAWILTIQVNAACYASSEKGQAWLRGMKARLGQPTEFIDATVVED